jgi:hydroxyacylglutathione hydrolase
MADVILIPALSDNYIHLIVSQETQEVIVVDPSEALPVLEVTTKLGIKVSHILLTHHHYDHVGGVEELKRQTGCHVVAFSGDRERIDHVDQYVVDQEHINIGPFDIKVMHIPGHTLGHVAYYFGQEGYLFAGDTLFSVGCGRMFEGTASQMLHSLNRLAALPADTKLYCGHEYTLHNIHFAQIVDPDNTVLLAYLQEVEPLRKQGRPSLPSTLGLECQVNPFLRSYSKSIRRYLGLEEATDSDVFAELRRRKDQF